MPANRRCLPKLLALSICVTLLGAACSSGDDSTSDSSDAQTEVASAEAAVPEPFYGGHTSDIYNDDAHWLCKPGISDDVCERDLATTQVHADGSTTVEEHRPAEDAPIDCFYAYPTVSSDEGGNSDLEPAETEEIGTALVQVARLSAVCDVYAPVYRQVTLAGIGGGGGDWDVAYADVEDAFKHYIDNHNDGRGFVLLGHSQGSSHLRKLMMDELDDEPELLDRLVGAYPIGWTMNVPEGEVAGGDFDNIPACEAVDQVGCVVSFASYLAELAPPELPAFGEPRDEAAMEGEPMAMCVNPANPGGSGFTQPHLHADQGSSESGGLFTPGISPFGEGSTETVPTPFAGFPDLLEVECRYENGVSYLAVTVHGDPTDGRMDDIGGHLDTGPPIGDWGTHLLDYQIVMGDIVDMVAAQSSAHDAG